MSFIRLSINNTHWTVTLRIHDGDVTVMTQRPGLFHPVPHRPLLLIPLPFIRRRPRPAAAAASVVSNEVSGRVVVDEAAGKKRRPSTADRPCRRDISQPAMLCGQSSRNDQSRRQRINLTFTIRPTLYVEPFSPDWRHVTTHSANIDLLVLIRLTHRLCLSSYRSYII